MTTAMRFPRVEGSCPSCSETDTLYLTNGHIVCISPECSDRHLAQRWLSPDLERPLLVVRKGVFVIDGDDDGLRQAAYDNGRSVVWLDPSVRTILSDSVFWRRPRLPTTPWDVRGWARYGRELVRLTVIVAGWARP